jgi:tetratricopeptide (TPR) repeat protein
MAALLRILLLAGAGTLSCLAQPVRADALSGLPASLSKRLSPVAEIGLDALDSDSRAQLIEARQRVADAIEKQAPDAELAESYGELGALYQVQFVYSPAATCYDNARRLAPGEFRWIYYSAYLAASIGELRQAVAGYEQARQLRPDYLALTLRLADAWRELDEPDRARQAYLAVINDAGLAAAAHHGLGQLDLLQRHYADAIDHFKRALALQPQANRVHYSLGQALRASGQREQAKQQFALMGDTLPAFTDPQIDSLQALKHGSHIHFITGMKAYRRHDYAAARDAFAAGLAREEDNVNARVSYARALYLSGDHDRAREQLQAALDRQPAAALASFLLGVLSEGDGDMDAARRHYQAALRAEPEQAGAHLQLGNDCYRRGQYEQAVSHYARSIAAAPENLAAYLPYAGALLQLANGMPRAQQLVERALQRFPEQGILEFLDIQLQASGGEAGEAGAALAKARQVAKDHPSPPAQEMLALALAASGDFSQASTIQESLVTMSAWSTPVATERLNRILGDYRADKLPQPEDLFTWSVLQAPAVQVMNVFRDYPATRPY